MTSVAALVRRGGDRGYLLSRPNPPVNLTELVATIKAEGTANATGDKQRACLDRRLGGGEDRLAAACAGEDGKARDHPTATTAYAEITALRIGAINCCRAAYLQFDH